MENPVGRQEFQEVQKDIDSLYTKSNKHDRQITVLETLVENLKGLPSAINSLEKTMALMGQNLESLNSKVDKVVEEEEENQKHQSEKISKIDNKSKVDVVEFVKQNWWGIMLGIALLLTWIENYAPK